MILIIIGVFGFAALGLAAYALLFNPQPPASQAAPPANLEPVSTLPTAALVGTPTPRVPTITAACLQRASGSHLGSSARVLDDSTIEAQVDGVLQRFRLAGILIPEDSPLSEETASTLREQVDGRELLLFQDPGSPAPAEGAPLPRYILVEDRLLNQELVEQGLGKTDLEAPEQMCANLFLQAEQQARAEKIGLWQPARVPTATFMPFVTLDPALAAPCDCMSRPVCSDFRTHDEAQACYNACNDYNSRLDEDRDGIACEALP